MLAVQVRLKQNGGTLRTTQVTGTHLMKARRREFLMNRRIDYDLGYS